MAASLRTVSFRFSHRFLRSSPAIERHIKPVARCSCLLQRSCTTASSTTTSSTTPDAKTPQQPVSKPDPKSTSSLQAQAIKELPSEDDGFREKFIPVSRRSLIREVMQDDGLLREKEKKRFEEFATGLDAAISNQYHGRLMELKQLFEPINPDKDTLTTRQSRQRELENSEFWMLQKLESLMAKANFYELPPHIVDSALEEHVAGEGVIVSVNRKNYDVLRFWALGQEIPPDQNPWYSRVSKNLFYRATKRNPPPPLEYFKRVVVAVRPKGQQKLSLKMFKEVPKGALEHLLPDGKIRMTKLDQGLIATTVGVASLTVLIKAVTFLADIQLKWTLAIAAVTGLTGLRFWNSYKNRRVKYLMQLSRTLYYKNVANNRGLLALLVDRAQDECFKEALLVYSFLLSQRPEFEGSVDEDTLPATLGSVRLSTLERNIERWVRAKTGASVEFDAQAAADLLKKFNLLREDGDDASVIPLDAAILGLPHLVPSIATRTDDLELEEGYDTIFMEKEEEYAKEDKKQRRHGWS